MPYLTDNQTIEIRQLISESQRFAVLGHHNPDGDSVSGSSAMFEILKQLGKEVSLLMPSKISDAIKHIPNVDHIIFHEFEKERVETVLLNTEVLFCIDFNAYKRAGDFMIPILQSITARKIMIDHHPQPEACAEFIISNTQVSSASELVYEFICEIGWEQYINQTVAEALFTGIMTDTNNFSVNCSRSRTFEIVSKLLAQGVERERIYEQVFNNFSISRLRFTGYFLDKKMRIYPEFQLAFAIFTNEEQNRYDFKHGDQEGLVNMPLSISDIDTSILVLQHDDFWKISLRSKGGTDVNLLARKYLNGGGHTRAAGGKLYFASQRKVEAYIVKSIEEFKKKTN